MGRHLLKLVNSQTFQVGNAQYIVLPEPRQLADRRSIYIKKEGGSGTLDIHPIQFSVNDVDFVTSWSQDGAALSSSTISEATAQSEYTWVIKNSPGPTQRLKIDVNTNTVVLSVWVCDID